MIDFEEIYKKYNLKINEIPVSKDPYNYAKMFKECRIKERINIKGSNYSEELPKSTN